VLPEINFDTIVVFITFHMNNSFYLQHIIQECVNDKPFTTCSKNRFKNRYILVYTV